MSETQAGEQNTSSHNLVSIFTRKEPCKYLHVAHADFMNTYMNDHLHSFGCTDCQRRFGTYVTSIRESLNSTISEMFKDSQETLE